VALALLAAAGSVAGYAWGQRVWDFEPVSAPLDEIAWRIGAWKGASEPIEVEVKETLGYDEAVHRVYRSGAGQPVHAWTVCRGAGPGVRGCLPHGDVGWPNRGWEVGGVARRPVGLPGTELEMSVRTFERQGRRQLVGYWAQDGNRPWTE